MRKSATELKQENSIFKSWVVADNSNIFFDLKTTELQKSPKVKKSSNLVTLIGVTNAHWPSPQPTAVLQNKSFNQNWKWVTRHQCDQIGRFFGL